MAATNVQAFSGDVEVASNLAVNTNTLFVDAVGGTVGIGSTRIDITDNTLSGAGNGLYIHNPVQGGHLLTLGTQRPWVFEQGLSDAKTELCLRALNSSKKFNIQSPDYSNVMTIVATDGGGSVGIGTTSPQEKLDVAGTAPYLSITDTRTSSGGTTGLDLGGIVFRTKDTTDPSPETGDFLAKIQVTAQNTGTFPDGSLNFFVGDDGDLLSSPSMVIEGVTGNVGIGTTNPDGFEVYNKMINQTFRNDFAQIHVNNKYQIDTRDTAAPGTISQRYGISAADDASLNPEYGELILGAHADQNQPNSDGAFISFNDSGQFYIAKHPTANYGEDVILGSNQSYPYIGTDTNNRITPLFTVRSSGNVGIGLTNPGTISTTNYPNVTPILHLMGQIYQSENNDNETWSIGVLSNDYYFRASINGNAIDNIARIKYDNGSYIDMITFTGQHRAAHINNIPPTRAVDYEGLIVCANRNEYESVNGDKSRGIGAITINEAVPLLSLSKKAYDKKCFGVISGSEDPDNRTQRFGNLETYHYKEDGDTFIFTNSVGEGAIWVTNINGPLESGDYITTSNVAGYGQKQDSEFLANYTVAKITMDCDFNPVTQPIKIIKKEMGDVNYWVKTTYENVTEEEYSNLTDENRRIVDGIYQEVINLRSKKKEDGHDILEVRQELVNVLDEHGQIQWEDDPSGATEKAYKIRYLDADGNITDEANAAYTAAFVGCTYHCG